MRNKVLDPRLARREAESRVCRGRGDDELISASLNAGRLGLITLLIQIMVGLP
jgi:hypothetical protein